MVTRISFISVLVLLFSQASFAAEDSVTVLVTWYSRTGHTTHMAEAVAIGASAIDGVEVRQVRIADLTENMLREADAVVVGSPVHSTNIAAPVMAMFEMWPFDAMRDKVGAAFVTSGGMSAGEELAQVNLLHTMLQYGMIVTGGPDWRTSFGAAAIQEDPFLGELPADRPRNEVWEAGEVDEFYLARGEALGRRVAEVTLRLR